MMAQGRKIAITDIHACLTSLQALIEEKLKITTADQLYFLGDYIDRGPDSKGVIDYIWGLEERGITVKYLRGNHEDELLNSISEKQSRMNWMAQGGDICVASFGVKSVFDIPDKYLDFFRNLPYYLEVDDFILVHAGLNFEAPNPFEDKTAMLWIRHFPVDEKFLDGRKLIHGHTPTPKATIIQNFEANHPVVNIDAGCYYNFLKGLGYLCALDMTNWELIFQENIEFVQNELDLF